MTNNNQSKLMKVPLFPLNSIVLPRGRIPLQLFEPRYLDMLSSCLKEDRGFVVVLLRSDGNGHTGEDFYDIGTYVRVIDFKPLENGMLGITVEGVAKTYVLRHWQNEDGLCVGDVEWLMDERPEPTPRGEDELLSVLKALLQHPVVRDLDMEVDYDDSREVGWRLTELLPLDNDDKQRLAELTDPLERLDHLRELIEELE